MTKCTQMIRLLISLISAFSLVLAVFLLPESVCAPGSEINACCADATCDTQMTACLCCHPGYKTLSDSDDNALASPSKSAFSAAQSGSIKIAQLLPSALVAADMSRTQTAPDVALKTKTNKLYLIKRSLLI